MIWIFVMMWNHPPIFVFSMVFPLPSIFPQKLRVGLEGGGLVGLVGGLLYLDVPLEVMNQWLGSMGSFTYLYMGYSLGV